MEVNNTDADMNSTTQYQLSDDALKKRDELIEYVEGGLLEMEFTEEFAHYLLEYDMKNWLFGGYPEQLDWYNIMRMKMVKLFKTSPADHIDKLYNCYQSFLDFKAECD